jgi:hypothetical protein
MNTFNLSDTDTFNIYWTQVTDIIKQRFDKDADIKSILFIIGLREFGMKKTDFTKEEKQDLMNLAVCRILSAEGYFEQVAINVNKKDDEWPIWKQSKALPNMDANQQDKFLKDYIIQYFLDEEIIQLV